MNRLIFSAAAVTLLPLSWTAAHAAEPAMAPCTATVAPGGELAPWTSPTPLGATGDAAKLPALEIGKAATVTLLPTPQVHYAVPAEKPGGPTSHGGLIGFDVAQPAIYRVALSTGAWVDVVEQDHAVTSVAHGHGPECSGVRKIVDFPLTPGRYTLQLAGSGAAQITVLIARKP